MFLVNSFWELKKRKRMKLKNMVASVTRSERLLQHYTFTILTAVIKSLGWKSDETIEEATIRETLEEARVCGTIEDVLHAMKSAYVWSLVDSFLGQQLEVDQSPAAYVHH